MSEQQTSSPTKTPTERKPFLFNVRFWIIRPQSSGLDVLSSTGNATAAGNDARHACKLVESHLWARGLAAADDSIWFIEVTVKTFPGEHGSPAGEVFVSTYCP